MKRLALVLGIIASLAIGQVANAITFGDSVNHWTNWSSSISGQNGTDVLGQPDIKGGDAAITANHMLTKIDLFADVNKGTWTGLMPMDLFINVLNSGNDNKYWDYVVKTESWAGAAGGSFGIYDISSLNISAYKTNTTADNVYDMAYARNGQPVGINKNVLTNLTSLGVVGFAGLNNNGFNTSYNFSSLVNGGLFIDNGFVLGWGVTCGNDVIYEQVPVPEPGTMVLLGAGLLGLAIFGKRRMGKSA